MFLNSLFPYKTEFLTSATTLSRPEWMQDIVGNKLLTIDEKQPFIWRSLCNQVMQEGNTREVNSWNGSEIACFAFQAPGITFQILWGGNNSNRIWVNTSWLYQRGEPSGVVSPKLMTCQRTKNRLKAKENIKTWCDAQCWMPSVQALSVCLWYSAFYYTSRD